MPDIETLLRDILNELRSLNNKMDSLLGPDIYDIHDIHNELQIANQHLDSIVSNLDNIASDVELIKSDVNEIELAVGLDVDMEDTDF